MSSKQHRDLNPRRVSSTWSSKAVSIQVISWPYAAKHERLPMVTDIWPKASEDFLIEKNISRSRLRIFVTKLREKIY